MKIGIDLDGVTADWVGSVCESLGLKAGLCTRWDSIFDITGMTPAQLFAHCEANRVFINCMPIHGAMDGLRLLHLRGHDINFITARPLWSRDETNQWLDAFCVDIPHDLDFEQHKSKVPCDLYLDDSPIVIAELYKAGRRVVRFDQPWNTTAQAWKNVADWPTFTRIVKELKK